MLSGKAGVYTGDGNREIFIDGKTVTIKGDGITCEIVIDADGSPEEYHNIFNIEGYSWGNLRLRNLTLTNSYGKSCIQSKETIVPADMGVVLISTGAII